MKKILSTTLFLLLGLAAWADELPTITVVYSGETATVTIPAEITDVTPVVKGANVTLTSTTSKTEYCYKVSGVSTDGSLKITGSYKLTLELAGLNLTSETKAAINIDCGKRIAVVVDDGTTNTLADGEAGEQKACFYFKGHPEFEGGGILNVTGNVKHAVSAKEYLEIKDDFGTLNVLGAVSDGIHCGVGKSGDDENNYFEINGGTINVSGVGGDCIDSDDYGKIKIKGGILNLTTATSDGAKAISCDSVFNMKDGTINIYCASNGGRGIKTGGAFTMSGGSLTATLSGGNIDDGEGGIDHCTGIKVAKSDAPADMTVSGGTMSFTMANDEAESFDCKGTFSITGGEIDLTGTKYAVNPEDFKNDMRAYVKVNLNGTDFVQYDYRKCQIGAYIGSTLSGGGTTKITPEGTYVYLPIRSNSDDGVVNFRVQNYDEGTTAEYTAGNFCQFSNDGELGTPSSPFELDIYSLNELTVGDDVVYTRTVTNAFGTVVLPFVPTSHENVKFYTISDVESNVLTLSEVADPVANTPYIFKVADLTVTPCEIIFSAPATALSVPTEPMSNSMEGGFTMYGTYKQKSLNAAEAAEAANEIYYISKNKFWHATGSLAVKPYRTWLEAPKAAGVSAYAIAIDGETTGIAEVEDGEMQLHFGVIHDLQGRKVTSPQSGQIYIIDGKKILY